ncbi:MAG: outer membrane beta-barrel protein [Luteolibacter sp.]
MKSITPIAASLIVCTQAFAATTSSKDGLQVTTSGPVTDTGLPMIARGVQEIGLSGYLNWETNTNYALNFSYGRFFTDNWLLGARAGIDGQNSNAGYTLGVFAEYNFLTQSPWVPFVGVSADYNRLENNGDNLDALRLGLELGVKYFFRPNIAASLSGGAAWNSDRFPEGDDFAKQINLGLRYYF